MFRSLGKNDDTVSHFWEYWHQISFSDLRLKKVREEDQAAIVANLAGLRDKIDDLLKKVGHDSDDLTQELTRELSENKTESPTLRIAKTLMESAKTVSNIPIGEILNAMAKLQ